MPNLKKADLLKEPVEHIDITRLNAIGLVDAMGKMAFQARNLARGAQIYDRMLADKDCAVYLCLAGSLFSAGLKRVILELVKNNMVDAIVSTGANIVDQDFFEALGFKHYRGTPFVNDKDLRAARVDRIYDTYIDEDQLGICDNTISEIAGSLPARPHSSREFIVEMGKYIAKRPKGRQNGHKPESVVLSAYEKGVPIFVPAFSDCSAGFGLLHHQWHHPEEHLSIDSAKDFVELTRIKIQNPSTGLLMIGGGVPKNFAQDVTVAAEMLGLETYMHKYAVQITVADERDGALSGSTLKEACSWGKVDVVHEQMVFAEASLALPLLASYAYHKGSWKGRPERRFNEFLAEGSLVAARR